MEKIIGLALILFAAAVSIGLGTIGTGIGQGVAVSKAMEGLGRNPEAGKSMFLYFILGLAFIESLALYSLLVSFKALDFAEKIMQLILK